LYPARDAAVINRKLNYRYLPPSAQLPSRRPFLNYIAWQEQGTCALTTFPESLW